MSGVGAAHSGSAAGPAAAGLASSGPGKNFAEGDTGAVAATVKQVPASCEKLANHGQHHNEEDKEEEKDDEDDDDFYDDHTNGCGCCGATLCYD